MPQVASLYLNQEEKDIFLELCTKLGMKPYAVVKKSALELIEKYQKEKKQIESTPRSEGEPTSQKDSGRNNNNENFFGN